MAPRIRPLFLLPLLALLAPVCVAQSVLDISLDDALSSAVERAGTAPSSASGYQSSEWLAALPSVGLNYLKSDQSEGVDETGLSLNLPLKSGLQRKLDRQLQDLSAAVSDAHRRRRELYYSGLIREAAWNYRVAETRHQFSERKLVLLRRLQARYDELLETQAVSRYGALLVQKELVEAEIGQQQLSFEVKQWQQRFRQITGLGSIPGDIEERGLGEVQLSLWRHPAVEALELGWQQRQAALGLEQLQTQPWQLALTMKNLDSPLFEENQYGFALEVPLSFIDINSQGNNSQWQQGLRDYELARDVLQGRLQASWERLQQEGQLLLSKQQLLEQSLRISEGITAEVEQLREYNEIGEEVILRRLMEAIDVRAAVTVNQVLLGQNQAMSRQAAGLPL